MSDVPPEPSPDPSASAAPQDGHPYQSLYRRYRPARFEEVRGQDHVVLALRNAVRDGRVAHAYLFSGPRGTGKTSTARILAKALNCTNLEDGEPCGVCASCVEIAKGTSLDVHELDAASNNGVEAMRDLVSRAALGTPGRQKVYIVDEVHMLSTAASNALLKTLEEPPAHVVFVLATTDPQKVLPTIRSRTQHFEFRLLDAETLGELLTQVRDDAHLDVTDEALDVAIRRGKGSARDALSVLDQVAASDSVDDDLPELSEVAEALAERDSSRALVAVAHLTSGGWSPQQLAGDLVEYLRQAFLTMVAPELVSVGDTERDEIAGLAERLGLAAVVRAMEVLGLAQVAMREAPDPRVNLEVALVRLAHPEVDVSPEALLARIERLERGAPVARPAAPPVASRPGPSAGLVGRRQPRHPEPATAPPSAAARPDGPFDPRPVARKTLGAVRRQTGASDKRGPAGASSPGGTEPGASSPAAARRCRLRHAQPKRTPRRRPHRQRPSHRGSARGRLDADAGRIGGGVGRPRPRPAAAQGQGPVPSRPLRRRGGRQSPIRVAQRDPPHAVRGGPGRRGGRAVRVLRTAGPARADRRRRARRARGAGRSDRGPSRRRSLEGARRRPGRGVVRRVTCRAGPDRGHRGHGRHSGSGVFERGVGPRRGRLASD